MLARVSSDGPILAFDTRLELGESPVWDERAAALYAVDILAGAVLHLDPATGVSEQIARLDDLVGAIVLRREGGLVAATGTSVVLLDAGLRRTVVAEIHAATGIRFNDGACDPQGRFWVGTMSLDERPDRGTLYRFDERGLVTIVESVSISNGIDWTVDGTRMIYADTPTRRIDSFAFDAEHGTLSDRRTLVELPGMPDGLTIDAEDHIWVALWDGWAVHRYRPDGTLDRVVELPVARPTSCAFGGADLADLYVTSARMGLTAGALEAQPHAGGVFVLRPGVRGRLPNRFAG
jgi:sugar lactone lactonase YvrE